MNANLSSKNDAEYFKMQLNNIHYQIIALTKSIVDMLAFKAFS